MENNINPIGLVYRARKIGEGHGVSCTFKNGAWLFFRRVNNYKNYYLGKTTKPELVEKRAREFVRTAY